MNRWIRWLALLSWLVWLSIFAFAVFKAGESLAGSVLLVERHRCTQCGQPIGRDGIPGSYPTVCERCLASGK